MWAQRSTALALALLFARDARASVFPEVFGLAAPGSFVTLCIPGVVASRAVLTATNIERMGWTAIGYTMGRANLTDDVAQLHCARGGRPDDAGGLAQLVGSNALALALAVADFALAGWRARRPEGDRASYFLTPFVYPGYRGLAVFGVGFRAAF